MGASGVKTFYPVQGNHEGWAHGLGWWGGYWLNNIHNVDNYSFTVFRVWIVHVKQYFMCTEIYSRTPFNALFISLTTASRCAWSQLGKGFTVPWRIPKKWRWHQRTHVKTKTWIPRFEQSAACTFMQRSFHQLWRTVPECTISKENAFLLKWISHASMHPDTVSQIQFIMHPCPIPWTCSLKPMSPYVK